jgi:hypothetical protein
MIVELARYLAKLTVPRIILWCYAIWYAVNVWNHFDPKPRLWLTSFGLAMIVGFALLLNSATSTKGNTRLDRWQLFRLFLTPFCVSSFAALVKDAGYILLFPPAVDENLVGLLCIAFFLALVTTLKKFSFASV